MPVGGNKQQPCLLSRRSHPTSKGDFERRTQALFAVSWTFGYIQPCIRILDTQTPDAAPNLVDYPKDASFESLSQTLRAEVPKARNKSKGPKTAIGDLVEVCDALAAQK
jgi:hypothetical protein